MTEKQEENKETPIGEILKSIFIGFMALVVIVCSAYALYLVAKIITFAKVWYWMQWIGYGIACILYGLLAILIFIIILILLWMLGSWVQDKISWLK